MNLITQLALKINFIFRLTLIDVDNEGKLYPLNYDKCDYFDFPIVNFPILKVITHSFTILLLPSLTVDLQVISVSQFSHFNL